jgi:hypothetical protein
MDRWTEAIRGILEQAPTRAKPLSSILEELDTAGVPVDGRKDWILRRLSELPEAFLVISDHRIPWVPWPSSTSHRRHGFHLTGFEKDPWILSRTKAPAGFGQGEEAVRRIQEGLQALGTGVDNGSQGSVARWIRANREGERACRAILAGKTGQA